VPPAYALPAATTAALGGVKKAAAVAAPAAGADAAALVTWATALTNALKAAGVLS
uniref:head fiber protein n=1 Tax=uncultured Parolsenella sp. TaxID=2083008 RepID=UPI0035A598B9